MENCITVCLTKEEAKTMQELMQVMIEPLVMSKKTTVIPKKKKDLEAQINYMKYLKSKFEYEV